MNIKDILRRKENLNAALHVALSKMELTDEVRFLREEIKKNQAICPHMSAEYNLPMNDGVCPYCGKKMEDK